MNWELSKDYSIYYYKQYGPEVLQRFFGQGCLHCIEDKTEDETEHGEFCKIADTIGGVDYFYTIAATQFSPTSWIDIASRVRFGKDEKAFSIRYKRRTGTPTEFEKTLYALKEKRKYPTYVSTMWISGYENGKLLSVAMCSTPLLYEVIVKDIGLTTIEEQYIEHMSDASFIRLPWDTFEEITKSKLQYRYEPNSLSELVKKLGQ